MAKTFLWFTEKQNGQSSAESSKVQKIILLRVAIVWSSNYTCHYNNSAIISFIVAPSKKLKILLNHATPRCILTTTDSCL